jgi:putative ATP-dependent endonuclease of OLD family
MLQHLAAAQAPVQEDIDEKKNEMDEVPKEQPSLKVPNLIIGIEEPELYQHPNRQRHLSKILLKLATGSIKGVADCTQIIYTTHSPLFVDIKRFDKVRRLHKICGEANKPKQTKVFCTNLDEINKIIGIRDLENMGISVIPCQSKDNLIKSIAIFRNFRIPVYAIWDSDYGNEQVKRVNHKLLRLFNQDIEDWPEKVTENFACFKHTIKETLRTEIDEEFYDNTLNVSCDRLCLRKRKDAFKNPLVIHEIIKEAKKQGKSSKTLEKIIFQIVTLRYLKTSVEGG